MVDEDLFFALVFTALGALNGVLFMALTDAQTPPPEDPSGIVTCYNGGELIYTTRVREEE